MRGLCHEARKEDDAKASAASEPLSFAHEATTHIDSQIPWKAHWVWNHCM